MSLLLVVLDGWWKAFSLWKWKQQLAKPSAARLTLKRIIHWKVLRKIFWKSKTSRTTSVFHFVLQPQCLHPPVAPSLRNLIRKSWSSWNSFQVACRCPCSVYSHSGQATMSLQIDINWRMGNCRLCFTAITKTRSVVSIYFVWSVVPKRITISSNSSRNCFRGWLDQRRNEEIIPSGDFVQTVSSQ